MLWRRVRVDCRRGVSGTEDVGTADNLRESVDDDGAVDSRRELELLGRADRRRALSLGGSVRLVNEVAGADMREGPVPRARSRGTVLRGKPSGPRDAALARCPLDGAMVDMRRPGVGTADDCSLRLLMGTSAFAVRSTRGERASSERIDDALVRFARLRARASSRCCSRSRSCSVIVRESSCWVRLRIELLGGRGLGRRLAGTISSWLSIERSARSEPMMLSLPGRRDASCCRFTRRPRSTVRSVWSGCWKRGAEGVV